MKNSQMAVLLAIANALLVAPAFGGDDVEWRTEAGFLAGFHDNYFYRDTPTPEETFLTVYGLGELTIDTGPGKLSLDAGASGSFGLEIDDTDFQNVNVGVGYKHGNTKAMLDYRRTFDKVFGEEDDASLFDVDSGEFTLRQNITDSVRAQGSFQLQNWDFSSPDNDRDALKYRGEGLVRWEICECFAVRGAFFWDWKDADSGRFDYDGPGFSVAAEIKPFDPVEVFVRYRRRWRDYEGAPSGDSNFNRDDTIDDVLANARWHLTNHFGLRLAGTFRHGDSDRSDRNYDAFSVTGGFFVTFGNGPKIYAAPTLRK